MLTMTTLSDLALRVAAALASGPDQLPGGRGPCAGHPNGSRPGSAAPSGRSDLALTPLVQSDSAAGLGDFTWTQVSTLAAALLAAAGVIVTLLVNAARARRDNLATLYADSLGAVAEYLEGPYRILRKDGESSTRLAITSKLSDVKTAIDHQQALMRLHARSGVADAYDAYVTAAKREAGQQMHDAWNADPVTLDAEVNLNDPLPRDRSEAAKANLVAVMQADLGRRWYRHKPRSQYQASVAAALQATSTASDAQPGEHDAPGEPTTGPTTKRPQDKPKDR